MKKIRKKDIEKVKNELAIKREEFECIEFENLDEKLKWIQDFFNEYAPMLERRFLTEKERENLVFLPDEIRIQFYYYFPEHGLNMVKIANILMYRFRLLENKINEAEKIVNSVKI